MRFPLTFATLCWLACAPACQLVHGRAPSWSPADKVRAEHAVHVGLREMRELLAASSDRVLELGGDAVECLIDVSYAADHTPGLRDLARSYARENLLLLLGPWLLREPSRTPGSAYGELVALAVYAHTLLPSGDVRTQHMIECANAALAACGSLNNALGMDPLVVLAKAHPNNADLYELVLWSITFTDAQTVPGMQLPARAEELLPRLWQFLASYPFVDAAAYPDGASDEVFYDTAYLVTHIGYMPTGYGRHALRVADAPWLLRFLRTNFDAVLAMGELDLVAEFVDLLLQFGFGHDDPQVLAGSRHLMRLFEQAGDSWLAHREPYEGREVDLYDLLHKPWTAISGLRSRVPAPCREGSYGAVFQQATATWNQSTSR